MKLNKAVFLDRDGTINEDKNYLYRREDFVFLPGVIEGLRLLRDAGFLLVIVTNQSGIGRGFYTEADFQALNRWMLDQLNRQGLPIAGVYYCPHLPDAKISAYRKECGCRKPKTGLFHQAAGDLDIDLDGSWAVGDKLRDCAICGETGCRGFLIGENEKPEVLAQVKSGAVPHVQYAKSLLDAANLIRGE